MLKLSGLTPQGVRITDGAARLRWLVGSQTIETDFDRFRPVSINADQAKTLAVTWRDFGDMPLNDPFFKFSIDAATKAPNHAGVFKTDWETASAVAESPDLLPFNGVIFHMARTGSTLIHRVLGCTGKMQSLSEVGSIDRVLQLTEKWPAEERNKVIQTLVAIFRRPRRPAERHFITKMTDSGASIRLPQFRAAFPKVPWIFVYREPVEVMMSALLKPTGNIDSWYKNRAQSAQRLGMPAVRDPAMWPAEFVARTLRRFCQSAVEAARDTPPGLFLAVHYSRLPEAIWETIGPHFGITFSDEDIALMRAESRFSSKKTERTEFRPDSDKKREEATPMMKRMAERFVAPVIEELKALPQG